MDIFLLVTTMEPKDKDLEAMPASGTTLDASYGQVSSMAVDYLHCKAHRLHRYQVLVTDKNAQKYSLWALNFNVTINANNTKNKAC